MFELNDLTTELESIWGNEANSVREAILHEPSIDKRFSILENYFLQKGKNKMENHVLVHYSVNQLAQSPQMWTIKDLSDKTI